jgi:hypothetical protein
LSYVSGNNKTELFMEGNWTGVFGLILQWWSYTKNMGNRCWRDAIRQWPCFLVRNMFSMHNGSSTFHFITAYWNVPWMNFNQL